MKKLLKFDLQGHFISNRLKYAFILILLFIGMSIGAVMGKNAYQNSQNSGLFESFVSVYTINGVTNSEVFIKSFISNIRTLIFLWISGFYIWLCPLNFLAITSKGFGVGYVISYFLNDGGIIGFFVAFTSLFFQNLLILPSFVVYSQIQFEFSKQYKKLKSSPNKFKQQRRLIHKNILVLLVMLLICVISSVIEAYAGNFCTKLLIQFWY